MWDNRKVYGTEAGVGTKQVRWVNFFQGASSAVEPMDIYTGISSWPYRRLFGTLVRRAGGVAAYRSTDAITPLRWIILRFFMRFLLRPIRKIIAAAAKRSRSMLSNGSCQAPAFPGPPEVSLGSSSASPQRLFNPEDLDAYLALPVKGRKPVNGVSGPVLHRVPFGDHTIDSLHVCLLGPTNFIVGQMTEDHLTLDSVDRSAILANSARQAELAHLEEIALGACAELVALVDSASGAENHGTVAFSEVDRVAQSDAAGDENGLRDWSPLEVAANKVMAELTSEAERIESGVGHTVTHRTSRQKSADAAGGAALRKKIKAIALALSSLLAAASALADATDEHRSYDSSGENGGEITKAFAAVLKACGISRSAYWKNTLVGRIA